MQDDVSEVEVEAAAQALWDDGARFEPTYMFPTREVRYRAARAAITAAARAQAKDAT